MPRVAAKSGPVHMSIKVSEEACPSLYQVCRYAAVRGCAENSGLQRQKEVRASTGEALRKGRRMKVGSPIDVSGRTTRGMRRALESHYIFCEGLFLPTFPGTGQFITSGHCLLTWCLILESWAPAHRHGGFCIHNPVSVTLPSASLVLR